MKLPQILIIDDFLGRPDNDAARQRFCDAMALKPIHASGSDGEADSAPYIGQVRFEREHGALAVAVGLYLIAVARQRRRVIAAQGGLILDDRDLFSHGGIIADRPVL